MKIISEEPTTDVLESLENLKVYQASQIHKYYEYYAETGVWMQITSKKQLIELSYLGFVIRSKVDAE